MKNIKKYTVMSLAAMMIATPVLASAENGGLVIMPINAPIETNSNVEVENINSYTSYKGTITEINDVEGRISIFVTDNVEDPYNGYIFHINKENIIVDGKSEEIVTADKLEKGMTISAYYPLNTPMALSLPAQLTPSLIVIEDLENIKNFKVSKFDEELLSADKMLKLNISENTKILDREGNETEEIKNKDLLVIYTVSTRSIPEQTQPQTIIVLDKEEKVTELNKININNKEISLKTSIYTNKDNIVMVPLRSIVEELGYEIKWNNESQSLELIKGAQWFNITVGQDNYNFAKMIVKLGAAPEIHESSTYVPMNFINEVLQYNINVSEGLLNITE